MEFDSFKSNNFVSCGNILLEMKLVKPTCNNNCNEWLKALF